MPSTRQYFLLVNFSTRQFYCPTGNMKHCPKKEAIKISAIANHIQVGKPAKVRAFFSTLGWGLGSSA